jgi:ribosomal protein L40E
MKKKRGIKTCTVCNAANGARSYECRECGAEFTIRTKKNRRGRLRPVKDYRNLLPGTTVKVVGGSGPYYYDANGNRVAMVDRGVYIVASIEINGLYVHLKGEGARSFLYMGPTVASPNQCGIVRRACKLLEIVPVAAKQ